MVQDAAVSLGLLRAHVAERAQDVASHGQIRPALRLRQPEVGDQETPLGVDQQVRRLDVAVDHAQLMGMLQGLGRLDAPTSHGSEKPRGMRHRFCGNMGLRFPMGAGRFGLADHTNTTRKRGFLDGRPSLALRAGVRRRASVLPLGLDGTVRPGVRVTAWLCRRSVHKAQDQAARQLRHFGPLGRLVLRHQAGHLPHLADHLSERLPFDVLHRVVMHAALTADRVDLYDAGVL